MVGFRSDWCISRQRVWGVPIPVFYDAETKEPLITSESIQHIRNLVSIHGSDCWWKMTNEELLAPIYRNNGRQYIKGTDTMDVWFDSGSSWYAVFADKQFLLPVDLYLEGGDQHRGWFQSSLLTSGTQFSPFDNVAAVSGKAPYKKVTTHGFVLDEKGRKMSKSLGNILEPSTVIAGGKVRDTINLLNYRIKMFSLLMDLMY
jgi:isoleucyl-tRNA synthetase